MDKWKIASVLAIMSLACATGYLMYEKPFCMAVESNDAEVREQGYIQGVNDVVNEAIRNGIAKVPYNETHFVGLVLWTGD